MAGIFKIKYAPDGTGTALTDANTVFFVTYSPGSNNNPGTRQLPVADYGVARNIANSQGKRYVVGRGKDETTTVLDQSILIADGYLEFTNEILPELASCYGVIFNVVKANYYGIELYNCTINTLYNGVTSHSSSVRQCFVKNYKCGIGGNTDSSKRNNTIFSFINSLASSGNNYKYFFNYIIISEFELFNINSNNVVNVPSFHNTVFFKSIKYTYKGTVIEIAYGNNPENYVADVVNSLTSYANGITDAVAKSYLLAVINSMFGEGCQIVDDSEQRVFNRYYNGTPIDFTLKTSNNPALTASSVGGYVGAYKGGVQLPQPEIKDINPATLAETTNTPDFVVKKPNGAITAVLGATQKLNAVKFTDVIVPKETMLSGSVSDFKSGLGSSIMTVGIIQPLSINTLPQEGFAVVPKDAPGVVSQTLPKLTMKFNGETELFYKASTGLPLTFNDLAGLGISTDKNLALYGTWGVTTADYEGYLLSGLNTVVAKKIKLKVCDIIIYIYNAAE